MKIDITTQSQTRPAASVPASALPDERINILIVDDEPKNLIVLETILDDPSYRLVRAESADQALLALMVEEFALLILDIRMPGMTGFELAQMIKDRKKTARVPIIFLTAYYNEDQHVLTGYDTGAVDYLHKPVNPTILRSKVAVFTELHRQRREIGMANRALLAEVTERRRAEERLQELNDTLEQRVTDRTAALVEQAEKLHDLNTALLRSNQELDDFAYVASHDLKEPLRGIGNYASFVIEDLGGKLDKDCRAKLDTVVRLCIHMTGLLDGLLEFSRVGRVEMAMGTVNLHEIVQQVVESLQFMLQENRTKVSIPTPLPDMCCDRARVGEIFRNLITNAVKYNDKEEKWVEIGFRSDGPGEPIVFHVRDNGIGISANHHDSIFRIFKRLHTRDKFGGGAGAGLTIAKKIVERHGGRIWVVSEVGLGTTFFFTLQAPALVLRPD